MAAAPSPDVAATDEARRSARDSWADTASEYFVEAARHVRTDPARSLDRLRLFLEGWAHAVCVTRDDRFKIARGGGLHRVELAKALEIATKHLPDDRKDLVRMAKALGDLFHHNQGARHGTTERMARGALLQCADLVEWLHDAVLERAPSPQLREAVDGLHSEAVPRWRVLGLSALGLAVVVAIVALVLHGRPSDAAPVVAQEPTRPTVNPAAVEPLSPTEVFRWAKRYEAALAARDISKLLSIHSHPTKRWFLRKNADFDRVRRDYEAAFAQDVVPVVSFEKCELAAATSLRCQAVTEPAIVGYPNGVPTCLAFDAWGRLTSRTELKDVPQCPPID